MHLVSESLTPSLCLMTSLAGSAALGVALYRMRKEFSRQNVPAFLALTGFIFVAQMINISTGLGFSGHLLGGAFLAILLGPWAAMVSMALILTSQAILIGDGSLITLGANYINMGIVAPWTGYTVFRLMQGRRRLMADAGQLIALALATYTSIIVVTLSMRIMLEGNTSGLMAAHGLIGLYEAMLSTALFLFCARTANHPFQGARSCLNLKGIACVSALAIGCIPFSSSLPDGLNYVMQPNAVLEQEERI